MRFNNSSFYKYFFLYLNDFKYPNMKISLTTYIAQTSEILERESKPSLKLRFTKERSKPSLKLRFTKERSKPSLKLRFQILKKSVNN